jgi:hypothetical protein
MRKLLIALGCVALLSTWSTAQEKALVTPLATPQAGIASICDSNTLNLASNCGFENGDFSNWNVSGPMDFVNVDPSAANSGSQGALFGTIGDYTYLTMSLPMGVPDPVNYHIEFWMANLVGGSGTYAAAYWSADGTFDDAYLLTEMIDSDPFDWTLYTFGPLPSAAGSQPAIQFIFRHDPDFFFLDDLDAEPSNLTAQMATHTTLPRLHEAIAGIRALRGHQVRSAFKANTRMPVLRLLLDALDQIRRIEVQNPRLQRFDPGATAIRCLAFTSPPTSQHTARLGETRRPGSHPAEALNERSKVSPRT